ncbi:MAG: biopolymer transporter ExbD, partial [Proteobacteria bacterium]|nr:biopolymer transporter ExbD [Pseudomonadota bacterium]
MNFQPKPREELELDITPLIDVVFLLLIFFMVSTTFEHDSELNITLPKAS